MDVVHNRYLEPLKPKKLSKKEQLAIDAARLRAKWIARDRAELNKK